MSLADSMRQTASIARWVSVAVTASDHTIVTPSAQGRGRRLFLGALFHLCAQAVLLLPELGRQRWPEVVGLEHLADLDLLLPATLATNRQPPDRQAGRSFFDFRGRGFESYLPRLASRLQGPAPAAE